MAAMALTPRQEPVVSTAHVHMVRVSVREHAAILREMLIRLGVATFRTLCADCQSTLEVVARFLALLELYREDMVAFDQVNPLGELTVRWTGDVNAAEFEVDEYAGLVAEADGDAGSEDDGQPDRREDGQDARGGEEDET